MQTSDTKLQTDTIFDKKASSYIDIINKSINASGESYEFFADLRVRMMKERYAEYSSGGKVVKILDYGCGIGATVPHLRRHFPGARILGVDTSPESIAIARKMSIPGVDFQVISDNGADFPNGEFDIIYSNGTFHHIHPRSRLKVLTNLRLSLDPIGYLFVFENNPLNPLTMRAMRSNPLDAAALPVKEDEMLYLGKHAGLKTVGNWYYFFFPHALRFLRPLEKRLSRFPLGGQYCVCMMDDLRSRRVISARKAAATLRLVRPAEAA